MMNGFDVLKERGFIYQLTDEEMLPKALNGEGVTFYVGFDPTADSLHIGHLLPVMAMRHLQLCGHKPLALVGGGTGLIGDPSGKTEARKLLTKDDVAHNVAGLRNQLARFLDFTEGTGAEIVNNADWLTNINYIDFLREVGRYFSINRMMSAESVKIRLEAGLTFTEFSYSLMQAYDFYYLNETKNCSFQLGGQDQWGNIVAGTELCRRKGGKQTFGATFPLLMNSQGQKFGKSVAGAIWLDENKLPIFDYYQFWRNADDADVKKLLGFFTMLPMPEINELMECGNINRVKEILAFEATMLAHGKEKATKAYLAACNQFGFADPDKLVKTSSEIIHISASDIASSLPTFEVDAAELEQGIWVIKLFTQCGLCKSNAESRRNLTGNALSINDIKVTDEQYHVSQKDLIDGAILLKQGKKNIKRIIIK
ncbi:MAG: tyrosine--tRNA ligase [Lentisphaeria bacterium]